MLSRVWTRLALAVAVFAVSGCSSSPTGLTALPTDEPTLGTLVLSVRPPGTTCPTN